jgi:hypothetical protein
MESGYLKGATRQQIGLKTLRGQSKQSQKAAPWHLADLTVVAASKTDAYPSTSSPADAKAKRAAEQVE